MKEKTIYYKICDYVGKKKPEQLRTYLNELINEDHSIPYIVNQLDPQSKLSPLHIACKNNIYECAKILLDYGANPRLVDDDGRTALHWACSTSSGKPLQDTKLVEKLVNSVNPEEKSSFINEMSCGSVTVLCYATWLKGKISNDIVKYLIQNGADVNLGNDIFRPLFACVNRNFINDSLENLNNLKILLENGADYLISDNIVGNAFYRASSKGLTRLAIEILKKAHSDGKYGAVLEPSNGWAYKGESIEYVVNSKHNFQATEEFRNMCLNEYGYLKDVNELINLYKD